eukprot:UN00100
MLMATKFDIDAPHRSYVHYSMLFKLRQSEGFVTCKYIAPMPNKKLKASFCICRAQENKISS